MLKITYNSLGGNYEAKHNKQNKFALIASLRY